MRRGGEQGSAWEEVLPVWVLSCALILFSWENSTMLPTSLTKFSKMVMDLFHRLHKEQGKTIILITHSPELAEETERIITIKDGLITGERKGSGRLC